MVKRVKEYAVAVGEREKRAEKTAKGKTGQHTEKTEEPIK